MYPYIYTEIECSLRDSVKLFPFNLEQTVHVEYFLGTKEYNVCNMHRLCLGKHKGESGCDNGRRHTVLMNVLVLSEFCNWCVMPTQKQA